jgi:transposase-like protein
VDSQGNTLEFLLSPSRDGEAAKRFFSKALAATHISIPRVITVDKNAAYPKAFGEPGMEPFFAERARRFSTKARPPGTLVEVHLAALRNAGFHEVGVIWQHLDNRVVMAAR